MAKISKTEQKTAKNKEKFLVNYEKSMANIGIACHNTGIDRSTYYAWINNDEEFAKKCEEKRELRKDFIESALDKKIKEGDTSAIIFASKTICRDRGYTEKQEVDVSINSLVDNFSMDIKKQKK